MKPKLEKVVSCPVWVLGAEVWSCIRADGAFNNRAVSSSLKRPEIFYMKSGLCGWMCAHEASDIPISYSAGLAQREGTMEYSDFHV